MLILIEQIHQRIESIVQFEVALGRRDRHHPEKVYWLAIEPQF
jgi:hypothetical protein